MAKKHIEPQIYRLPTKGVPRYVRAEEIVPGLLVHPDVSDLSADLDDEQCCWSISHKDSGRLIVGQILEKHLAIRACRKLNALCDANCERHWLNLNADWCVFATKVNALLPFAETWPKELG